MSVNRIEAGSLLVAIAALVLSLFNFYAEFFREDHEMSAFILPLDVGQERLEIPVILRNDGTEHEAIQAIRLFVGATNEFKDGEIHVENIAGPLVVAPGEANVIRYAPQYDYASLWRATHAKFEEGTELHIGIIFETLNEEGVPVFHGEHIGGLIRSSGTVGGWGTFKKADLFEEKTLKAIF